jgi:hypothetical protein
VAKSLGEINNSFHQEWKTVNGHRVLLSARDGFPGDYEYEIAKLATETINAIEICAGQTTAQLVEVFNDDTNSVIALFIGVWREKLVETLEAEISKRLEKRFEGLMLNVVVEVVKSKHLGDHFNYAAFVAEHFMVLDKE